MNFAEIDGLIRRLQQAVEDLERQRRPQVPADEWLTPKQTVEITKMNWRWFRGRADRLAFIKKIGPKTYRVSREGLQRWMGSRK
jgi:hypothetical protein